MKCGMEGKGLPLAALLVALAALGVALLLLGWRLHDHLLGEAGVGEVELPQPHMENLWTGDTFLQSYLTRVLPPDLRRQLEPDLARSAVHSSSQLYTVQVGRAVRPGGGAAGPPVRGGSAQTGGQQCLGR